MTCINEKKVCDIVCYCKIDRGESLQTMLCYGRNDSEIVGYALETLCNVMSNEPPEDGQYISSCVALLSNNNINDNNNGIYVNNF